MVTSLNVVYVINGLETSIGIILHLKPLVEKIACRFLLTETVTQHFTQKQMQPLRFCEEIGMSHQADIGTVGNQNKEPNHI
jgi:hypothetical protein